MFRSVVAVVAGYLAMAIATIFSVAGLSAAFHLPLDPEAATTAPPTAYVIANLFAGLACAVLGGFVTARIASRSPLRHAAALAAFVFVAGIAFAIQSRGGPQPGWYLTALPVVGAAGVVLGGWLRR